MSRILITPKPIRLSLTPLTDCVFILLVFFMLQTNFVTEQQLLLSTVSAGEVPTTGVEPVAIELHADGSLWLNNKATSVPALKRLATTLSQTTLSQTIRTQVVIAVDADVALQDAVDVMDYFFAADMVNVTLVATQQFVVD